LHFLHFIATQCKQFKQSDARGENAFDRLRDATHHWAKLNEKEIQPIWARLIAGEPDAEIAKDYGVSSCAIRKIRLRQAWTHITQNLLGTL
jgi:FixJ family two-component response regulator